MQSIKANKSFSGQTSLRHTIKKTSSKTLEELRIPVVAKEDNPPATPQIRPIERLWALLKSRVYAGGFEAETKKQLITRIRSQMARITAKSCQNLWNHARTKIRFVADRGNAGLREL